MSATTKTATPLFTTPYSLDYVGEGELSAFNTKEGRDAELKWATDTFGVCFTAERTDEDEYAATMQVMGTKEQLQAFFDNVMAGADYEIKETMENLTRLTHELNIDADFGYDANVPAAQQQLNVAEQYGVMIFHVGDEYACPTYNVYGTSDQMIKFVKEYWAPMDEHDSCDQDFWLHAIKDI